MSGFDIFFYFTNGYNTKYECILSVKQILSNLGPHMCTYITII